jgi:hypothetical protein
MSGRLSGLKDAIKAERQPPRQEVPTRTDAPQAPTTTRAKARAGKHALVGYYSEEMTTEVNVIAKQRRTTVQAIIGEALDLWMEQNGKHRFNER